jgi:hypothetical protein
MDNLLFGNRLALTEEVRDGRPRPLQHEEADQHRQREHQQHVQNGEDGRAGTDLLTWKTGRDGIGIDADLGADAFPNLEPAFRALATR